MGEGFYKQNTNNPNEWIYAPNKVYGPGYTLCCVERDEESLPVDGWDWYDEAPEGYVKFQEWNNSKACKDDDIDYDTYFAAHAYFTSEAYLDDN